MLVHGERVKIMSDSMLYNGLKDFMGCEGKSCSFASELTNLEHIYGNKLLLQFEIYSKWFRNGQI